MKRADITYQLAIAPLRLLALIPLAGLYPLSTGVAFLLQHVVGYRRKIVRRNLKEAFPDMSEKELGRMERNFYRHLTDVMVETVKLLNISDRAIRRRVEVEGAELVVEAAAKGPVILMLGHLGNWEWVPAVSFEYASEIHSYHLYKPLRDKIADRLMLKLRSRLSSKGIPQKRAIRELIAKSRAGEKFMVGFIADLRPNSADAHFRVDFLNHDTPVDVGAETLGNKIGASYLFLDVSQPRRGHYKMKFSDIDAKKKEEDGDFPVTKAYFRMLNAAICRQPHLWMWSHRRWLFK